MCSVATECQVSSPEVGALTFSSTIFENSYLIVLYANCQCITKNGIPMKFKIFIFLIMPNVIKLYIWDPHTFSVKGL